MLSGNRPGIAFLCYATSQESPAARSGSEAAEMWPPVLWDRAVRAAVAPQQHPPPADAPMYTTQRLGWLSEVLLLPASPTGARPET